MAASKFSGTFQTADALVHALAARDISIPEITKGHKTLHKEDWSICRLLATLARSPYINYPLVINPDQPRSQRPDLIVSMNGVQIGIECTEAVSETMNRARAKRARAYPGAIIYVPLYRSDEPPKSKRAIAAIASGKYAGPPRMGNAGERSWADGVVDRVKAKTASAGKEGFQLFSKNWLLIYDNLSAHEEIGEAAAIASCRLCRVGALAPFERVFVEGDSSLVVFSETGRETIKLIDLWNGK
jgi:hypothetical protein